MSNHAVFDNDCSFLTEVYGDVFSTKHSLGHCVSADFKMGRGIARAFKEKFGNVRQLKQSHAMAGGLATIAIGEQFVYYLVTKRRYFQKPTYTALRSALIAMRNHAQANNISHIALPKIGTGLDKLSWATVKGIIKDTFKEGDIHIVIYHYE